MNKKKWIVSRVDHDKRLSSHLCSFLTSESKKSINWLLNHNRCRINGTVERFGSYHVKEGDVVEIDLEPVQEGNILYEDPFLVIFNKPACTTSESLAKKFNYFLVHRLDRDTTGVMIFAKDLKTRLLIENLFRQRSICKEYLAIVSGKPKKKFGTIKKKLQVGDGVEIHALTHWEYLQGNSAVSLLRCIPHTGRKHQIRIHLLSMGHPIYGDPVYGDGRFQRVNRPLLHANKISFQHPLKDIRLEFQAPIPKDFQLFLKKYFRSTSQIF